MPTLLIHLLHFIISHFRLELVKNWHTTVRIICKHLTLVYISTSILLLLPYSLHSLPAPVQSSSQEHSKPFPTLASLHRMFPLVKCSSSWAARGWLLFTFQLLHSHGNLARPPTASPHPVAHIYSFNFLQSTYH